jgi:BirA family biotin operon repressor/biotin-[acetyl-CoA-carboxylase] ligase
MVTGNGIDRCRLAAAMISELHSMSLRLLSPPSQWMHRYRENCITIGQDISLLRGNDVHHGHAIDVDDNGALLVRFPDGHIESVNSGEVSVRGMYGYV